MFILLIVIAVSFDYVLVFLGENGPLLDLCIKD